LRIWRKYVTGKINTVNLKSKVIKQNMNNYLDIHSEVQKALDNKQAVVALESTIISHGMPYPKNLETALMLEDEVRKNGAIPATIALINGKIKVGLTMDEISFLAKEGTKVIKTSRRDIPYVLAQKLTGATTVATTMIAAEKAGIAIFATGGIGGVHRGASETFDISADLQELANTNVAVVCAGIKAILDLELTLEYLETLGVPVLGYQTEELPAFYTRKSGFNLDYNMQTPKDIADLLKAKWNMGLKGGVVIANPIPKESSMDFNVMTTAIDKAIQEQNKLGIKGKESTPFLLAKVKELTKDKSLESNIELVKNNVILASKLAVAYEQE
jgi:pseudouridine-5'-phosphate glycosidase